MKYLIIPFILMFANKDVLADGPEDFMGTFKGNEKIVITCSNASWNKNETRSWQTTNSDLNGNSFKGLTEAGGGKYDVEGTISGNTATGTFKGKDGFGNPCNGEFKDTINGNELKADVRGTCPTVSCDFKGEVTATKQ